MSLKTKQKQTKLFLKRICQGRADRSQWSSSEQSASLLLVKDDSFHLEIERKISEFKLQKLKKGRWLNKTILEIDLLLPEILCNVSTFLFFHVSFVGLENTINDI